MTSLPLIALLLASAPFYAKAHKLSMPCMKAVMLGLASGSPYLLGHKPIQRNGPSARPPVPATQGSKMHRIPPSQERANLRSAPPMGFANAVFQANV